MDSLDLLEFLFRFDVNRQQVAAVSCFGRCLRKSVVLTLAFATPAEKKDISSGEPCVKTPPIKKKTELNGQPFGGVRTRKIEIRSLSLDS
jgi:hypothetical protein